MPQSSHLDDFNTICMDLGKKLLELRKRRGLTREALAKMIGTSGAIIGKYEREERTPSVEIAKNIAQALDVSLDFLAGNTEMELDAATLNRIQEVAKLSDKEQEHIFITLDAMIRDFKNKQAYS